MGMEKVFAMFPLAAGVGVELNRFIFIFISLQFPDPDNNNHFTGFTIANLLDPL